MIWTDDEKRIFKEFLALIYWNHPETFAEKSLGEWKKWWEDALGDGEKRVQPCEEDTFRTARRILVAARPIKKGEVFTEENLTSKRPGAMPKYIADKTR